MSPRPRPRSIPGQYRNEIDEISAASCYYICAICNFTVSYDYDGSVSGLSEDDLSLSFDFSGQNSVKERYRGATVLNRGRC